MGSFSNINLNQLVHFHAVARNESLRLAAKELGLSAPTITHSLNRLEEGLGFRLCIRERRRFQLTDRGKSLFERARRIIEELDGFAGEDASPSTFGGLLNIAVIDHFENPIFTRALETTLAEFPRMKCSVQVYDSDTILERVRSGDLDFGFGIFEGPVNGLKLMKVGEERLGYFIAHRHPLWKRRSLSKDDLQGQRVVWVDAEGRSRRNLETEVFSGKQGYRMQVAGYANNLGTALKFLLSGWAIVPLPPSYVESLSYPKIKRLPIGTNAPTITESCVYRSAGPLSLAATRFLRRLDQEKNHAPLLRQAK